MVYSKSFKNRISDRTHLRKTVSSALRARTKQPTVMIIVDNQTARVVSDETKGGCAKKTTCARFHCAELTRAQQRMSLF